MNIKFQITKFCSLFKQGLSPLELCQSVVVSATFTIIPILGVSSLILTSLSLKRKWNLPLMLGLSYMLWPLQILLIIPFIHLGEFIFGLPPSHHTANEIIRSFENSFFQSLGGLFFELLCGLGGWLLTAVPLSLAIYLLLSWLLKHREGATMQ